MLSRKPGGCSEENYPRRGWIATGSGSAKEGSIYHDVSAHVGNMLRICTKCKSSAVWVAVRCMYRGKRCMYRDKTPILLPPGRKLRSTKGEECDGRRHVVSIPQLRSQAA